MKCAFCPSEGELHEVEAPAIRLCTDCREKLNTHIAVVCIGCDSLYWIRKTPENVMQAAGTSDLPPQHITDNLVIHEIKTCKRCYEGVKEFTAQVPWVQ